jgi:hypothetical protein
MYLVSAKYCYHCDVKYLTITTVWCNFAGCGILVAKM